ncbi:MULTISPECIES: helix-turn-helix domain-containing protein [unclassified Blastococcus]|uniref:MmyB family transcriptional regulator n=1 Tax=unclassified Blastococcus TaxID=2619396 RepID=UPI001EF08FD0|nr:MULTISPECIES: helix-turn-helix domain-containing protein [unclassified Blastococcus]
MTALQAPPGVGELLRRWRQRRRLSQLALALAAGISARHLSFVETGRSRPSREVVLLLAEHLEVPLRERNELLVAAGHAPEFGRRRLDGPDMATVRAALDLVLAAYEPFPALVVDRGWHLVAANGAVALLTEGVAPALLEPPVNVLRLSLHPDGLAPRILDLPQWRRHVLHRLAREVHVTGDPSLGALHRELVALPGGTAAAPPNGIAVPLRVRAGDAVLSFLSTVTTFGTAVDVTAAELSIEAFLPADGATAEALRGRAGGPSAPGATRVGAAGPG